MANVCAPGLEFPVPVMSSNSSLLRPFTRLVTIEVLGRTVDVPENNPLLRCLQYLAPEAISYGRFCWNEDCQYCRVVYDMGQGTESRAALACKLMVAEGMRTKEVSQEVRYCLRDWRGDLDHGIVDSSDH
jgi:hypothetical protein